LAAAKAELNAARKEILRLEVEHDEELKFVDWQLKMLQNEQNESLREAEILKEKIEELKRNQDVLKPLLDVGAATRLRCLEKFKRQLSGSTRVELNQDIIEKGNVAAHHANGAADLALALGGYLEGKTGMDDTLKDLYQAPYEEWKLWPSMLQKAKDWRATIQTIETADYCRVTPTMEMEHSDMWDKLVDAYNASPKSDFDESLDNKRTFERLEELTDQIIYRYRNSCVGPRDSLVSVLSRVRLLN
jgi:hypothetical protein